MIMSSQLQLKDKKLNNDKKIEPSPDSFLLSIDDDLL